jgi:hypothetical protein
LPVQNCWLKNATIAHYCTLTLINNQLIYNLIVVRDFVTAAAAGKAGLEHVRNFVDGRRGCRELDAFEQRFADVLKTALKNSLPNEMAKDAFEQRHQQILRRLKEIQISDTNDAVSRLYDEITNYILNELDLNTTSRDDLHEAVETAYCAAIDEFIDEARAKFLIRC